MESKTKYCVAAMLDLLGFSAHLEVGADLRTKIGIEAQQRLLNLKNACDRILSEKEKYPNLYPAQLQIMRINDALFFTMDLPDALLPEVGQKAPYGYSQDGLEKFNEKFNQLPESERNESAISDLQVKNKIENTRDLALFVGIIARTHTYISECESSRYFPGPKTLLSTGFRLNVESTGIDDLFSANFAFANAYQAEKKLHGANFFVEDTIIRLLAMMPYAMTLLRYSSILPREIPFDLKDDYATTYFVPGNSQWTATSTTELDLMRKQYFFRELNAYPLVLFQLLDSLIPYLTNQKQAIPSPYFKQTLDILKSEPTIEEVMKWPHRLLPLAHPTLSKNINNLLRDMVSSNSPVYYRDD